MQVKHRRTFYSETDCNQCMKNNCQIDIPVTGDPAEDFDPLIYIFPKCQDFYLRWSMVKGIIDVLRSASFLSWNYKENLVRQ